MIAHTSHHSGFIALCPTRHRRRHRRRHRHRHRHRVEDDVWPAQPSMHFTAQARSSGDIRPGGSAGPADAGLSIGHPKLNVDAIPSKFMAGPQRSSQPTQKKTTSSSSSNEENVQIRIVSCSNKTEHETHMHARVCERAHIFEADHSKCSAK